MPLIISPILEQNQTGVTKKADQSPALSPPCYLLTEALHLSTREESSVLLTEHHLQPHQAAHEVVEVDGHVGVGVSGHQQLVDGVVEGETWMRSIISSSHALSNSRDAATDTHDSNTSNSNVPSAHCRDPESRGTQSTILKSQKKKSVSKLQRPACPVTTQRACGCMSP